MLQPPRSLCSLPPEGAQASNGHAMATLWTLAARRET